MRRGSCSRRHHRVTVGVFLIVAALLAGVTACDGTPTYQLTVSSGSGGSVPDPGEGTHAYPAGTVVPVIAIPDEGYQFESWTGNIGDIANPNAGSTTITVNGNCAIVANFETEGEGGPDGGGSIRP